MPCSNGQASCWHFSGFPPVYLCRQKIPKVFWAFPNRKKQTLSKQQLPQKWRQLTSRLCCLNRQANWGGDLSLETFGTVYNCPHQGWLRGFKPTMLSFLGPESLSLQLVAKLWSHWKAKRYLYPPVLLREPFLHKGPFFFPKGVSRAGCAVSSFMMRTPGPWVTWLCCDITPCGRCSINPPLPGPRSKAVK